MPLTPDWHDWWASGPYDVRVVRGNIKMNIRLTSVTRCPQGSIVPIFVGSDQAANGPISHTGLVASSLGR